MTKMQFFEVGADVTNVGGFAGGRGKFTFISSEVCDAKTGVALDDFQDLPLLKTARAVINSNLRLPDNLYCQCGNWLLISAPALEVFKRVQCCNSMRWVPTSVVSGQGTPLAEFYLGYGAREWDVWDYDRSRGQWADGIAKGSKVLLYFHDAVLDVNKVPAFDVFFSVKHKWIIRDTVRRLLMNKRLSGFEFNRIDQ